MFVNQVIDDAHKNYNVNACLEQKDNNNYIKIGDYVHKCSSSCMQVEYTLYIYACSYEDALTKIANIPKTGKFTLKEESSGLGGKKMIYIICPLATVEVDLSNTAASGTVEEVSLNGEVIDFVVFAGKSKSQNL